MKQPFAPGIIGRCPNCGHSHIAVRVLAWADFKDGEPYAFDPDDIAYVQPIAGADAICRACAWAFAIRD